MEEILRLYRELLDIRNTPGWLKWTRRSHKEQYILLRHALLRDLSALVLIVLDPNIDEDWKHELFSIAGHGGSIAKEKNLHLVPVTDELRKYIVGLSPEWQNHLDWLKQVHGY